MNKNKEQNIFYIHEQKIVLHEKIKDVIWIGFEAFSNKPNGPNYV
jgi:hypothetical protein